MALYIDSNVASLQAQHNLKRATRNLDNSYEKLSSGARINNAHDDAAGLQIVNRMDAQVEGLDRAVMNAQNAISLAQTAEGAMEELSTSLQRMRVLAVQAQDGVLNTNDRESLDAEVTQLLEEMSRIATTTQFAGKNILDGQYAATFLIGSDVGDDERISFGMSRPSSGGYGQGWGAAGLLSSAESLDITTAAGASVALANIDKGMEILDQKRSDLGAKQNRFQATVRNLTNISNQTSMARSRIEDTDFAKETSTYTKNQILQQSTQTILGQANQRPQAALSLLG